MNKFLSRIKLPQKLTTYFLFLVVTGVISSTGWFLVRPIWGKVQGVAESVRASEDKLAAMLGKINVLSGVPEEKLQESLNSVQRAIPNKKDVIDGILTIKKVAGDMGVLVESLNVKFGPVDSDKSPQGDGQIKFSVSLSGSGENLQEFIKKISSVSPAMVITGLQISVGKSGIYSASTDIVSFYSSGSVELGKQTSVIEPFSSQEEALLAKFAGLSTVIAEETDPGESATSSGKTNPFSD